MWSISLLVRPGINPFTITSQVEDSSNAFIRLFSLEDIPVTYANFLDITLEFNVDVVLGEETFPSIITIITV